MERRLIEYVSAVDDGNEHMLIAIDPAPDAAQVLASSRCRYLIIRRRMRFDPIFPLRLALLIRRQSPDIVYCRGFTAALWVSLGPPMLRSVPLVRSEHGSLLQHGKYRTVLERIMNWRFEKIVTVSSAMATEINVRLGVQKSEIQVIHYGLPSVIHPVASRAADAGNVESGVLVIGNIANFHTWKNHICIVNAAPLILEQYPKTRFVLVGGDIGVGNVERCKARVRRLGVEESFEFTGPLADASATLATFDLFVLPSVFETFGAVVVEAMLAGVPVIASNSGAMPELIEHGKTGILVDPTDPYKGGDISSVVSSVTGSLEPAKAVSPGALASAVIDMIDSIDEWTETAKSVQREASERYDFRRYQDRMAVIYRESVQSFRDRGI